MMDLCEQVRADPDTRRFIEAILSALLSDAMTVDKLGRVGWRGAGKDWCVHQLMRYALSGPSGFRSSVETHEGCPYTWAGNRP